MSGDVLAMPDLLSQGYGQIAKMIMADERMTCEAKCIYSLLASFSGGGCAPYPSVEYQLRKLHLSRQRYYRHRRFLTAFGYLVVEQTRDDSHRGNNRYVLSYAPKVDAGELARLRDEWGGKLDQYLAPEEVEALLAAERRGPREGSERNPRSELQSQNVTVGGDSRNPSSELRSQNVTVATPQENPRSELQSRFLTVENVTTNINTINKGKPDQPASPAPQVEAGEPPAAGGAAGEPEPEGFAELAATWPKPVGARERPECAEAYGRALAEGRTPRQVAEAAERYLRAYRAEHPGGEIRYVKRLKDWLVRQDGLMFYGKRPARRPPRRPEAPEREECATMERQAEMAGLLRDVAVARARGSAAALGAARERLAAALAAPGGGPAGREGKE